MSKKLHINRDRVFAVLNLMFIIVFLVQFNYFQDKLNLLISYQSTSLYKYISGLLLLCYLFSQNALILFRTIPRLKQYQNKVLDLHILFSLLAVPLLFVHTTQLGSNQQFLLTITFIVNIVFASLSPRLLNLKGKYYRIPWVTLHILLSVFLCIFVIYHMYIAFSYN